MANKEQGARIKKQRQNESVKLIYEKTNFEL